MKKFLQGEWGQAVYQGVLYGVEILMYFGVSVNLSAFYMGVTSGWVSLFTYMLITGAAAFSFLLNLIHHDQRIDQNIEKRTILIRIILYAISALLMDLRTSLLLTCIHIILYFLGNKRSLRAVSFPLTLCILSFGYMKGWISMAECMVLAMSEHGIFSEEADTANIERKGYTYISLWKMERSLIPSLLRLIILKCIQYGCVLFSFALWKDAVIEINDLQELFQYKTVFIYWMFLCVIYMISTYFQQKSEIKMMEKDSEEDEMVRRFHASCIPERIAFIVMMIVFAFLLINASKMLSLCILLMCISFSLAEMLICSFMHTTWIHLRNIRTCLIRLFLTGFLVIIQTVYDGIFVDYSVVIMSVFLFCGILQCIDTWKKNDALVDSLVSEEQ